MTKQEHIVEMATILWHEAKQKPNYMHGSYNIYLEYAEALYNAGCRKIRKTEVVVDILALANKYGVEIGK